MFCSCVPLTSFLYFFLLPLTYPLSSLCPPSNWVVFWVGNTSTFDFQPWAASILNARRVNWPVQQGWFSSGLGHPQNVSQWQKLLTLPLHRTRQLSWQWTPFQMHFIFLLTWFLSSVQEQMVGCVFISGSCVPDVSRNQGQSQQPIQRCCQACIPEYKLHRRYGNVAQQLHNWGSHRRF